jgi:hypothetical protein
VDEEGTFRFVEVATGGFIGIGNKHHLVPVEVIAEEEPGSSITLTLDQQSVLHSAPTLGGPGYRARRRPTACRPRVFSQK